MKRHETPGEPASDVSRATNHAAGRYHKVKDGRKQPIRGLWRRGERFYARLTVEDHETGAKVVRWAPLLGKDTKEPVRTVAEAVKAHERLKLEREDGNLPTLKRTPKFSDYVSRYAEHLQTVGDKQPATIQKAASSLRGWANHLGDMRLDKVSRRHIIGYVEKLTRDGISPRTCNLHVIAFRGCMKLALDEGYIRDLPTRGMRPLKTTEGKRSLFTQEIIEAICSAAFEPAFTAGRLARPGETGRQLKNAQQFSDYVRLMAYCGSRRNETLRLRWQDVDFQRQQLTIGADGLSKNRESRVVDFNPKLEAHLRSMSERRTPDSDWIFPSPQRGDRDVSVKTFKESLWLARQLAAKNLPRAGKFGFHDCRHHFISFAVMSGIDYMTIASWVGHKDGGVLIGKVYGHLADDHKKEMAGKLVFEPQVLKAASL